MLKKKAKTRPTACTLKILWWGNVKNLLFIFGSCEPLTKEIKQNIWNINDCDQNRMDVILFTYHDDGCVYDLGKQWRIKEEDELGVNLPSFSWNLTCFVLFELFFQIFLFCYVSYKISRRLTNMENVGSACRMLAWKFMFLLAVSDLKRKKK